MEAMLGDGNLEIPPGSTTGTEVFLLPALQHDIARVVLFDMFQCEWQRGGPANDSAGRCVLRSVARAHELILGLVPRDDTSQMGAHSVEGVILEIRLIICDDEISGIAAKPLDKLTRACEMRVNVLLLLNIISESVLRDGTAGTRAARLGDEKKGERAEDTQSHGRSRPKQEQIHGVTLGHIRDKIIRTRSCHAHGSLARTCGGMREAGGVRQWGHGGACELAAREDGSACDECHGWGRLAWGRGAGWEGGDE